MSIDPKQLQRPQADPADIFIRGWGRMGVHWGVGKVMAEIQALLYLSPGPLGLAEMSARLKTSRSNISLNVRALQDLGVVRKVIVPGDRKDYYTAEPDLDHVVRRLAAAKKKRELDPALDVISRAIEAAGSAPSATIRDDDGKNRDASVDTERLRQLKDMMEKIGCVFDAFIGSNKTPASTRAAGTREA
jgi:DNA-binding transcriptional regulator GbsR (MarR family)